jgi:hypothetical protein
MDDSIISDTEFDKLCKDLLANWSIQVSGYKKYVSKNDLEAGTGYTLFYNHETGKRDYPEEIKEAAEDRLMEYRAKSVVEYHTSSDDPDELYADLEDATTWFLIGLQVDYKHFFKCNPKKQKMALGVIERILKEREDDSKDISEGGEVA